MTFPNSQVWAFASTTDLGNNYWSGLGSSTLIQAGISYNASLHPSSRANVGIMTADLLYTSVSNAIEGACPTPTAGMAVTSCSDAAVTDISYVDDEHSFGSGGELGIGFETVSYTGLDAREGLIALIAGLVAVAFVNNTRPTPYCWSNGALLPNENSCTDETRELCKERRTVL